MAKDDMTGSQGLHLTFEQLQEILTRQEQTTLKAIETFVDKQKAPSAVEIARKERSKKEWRQVEDDNKRLRLKRENACEHRKGNGMTAYWLFDNVFPAGAQVYICCRCWKRVYNYVLDDPKTGKPINKLISNPEFEAIRKLPRLQADIG